MTQQIKIFKFIAFAFILLSLIGFFDAAYLAIEHFRGAPVTCSVFEGCEKVTTSSYAAVGPIPVALLGAMYYIIIFFLAVVSLETGSWRIIYAVSWFTIIGFLASLWFMYLQLFVIKAICPYCVASAITSTLLFIAGIYVIIQNKNLNAPPKLKTTADNQNAK